VLETSETVALEKKDSLDAASAFYDILVQVNRLILFPPDTSSPLNDLPVSQVRCLNAVGGDEGRKMQEIAARLHIKLPAMSQMVDRLVRKGLMERRPDPTDRRVARLHLTPRAVHIIAEARQIRVEHLHRISMLLEPAQILHMTEDLRLLAKTTNRMHQDWAHESCNTQNTNEWIGTVERHDPLVEMLAQRAQESGSQGII
jgi:DNA-binding MarR family transcriptional regulator